MTPKKLPEVMGIPLPIIAIVLIVIILAIFLMSAPPAVVETVCGDGSCTLDESCSSCPVDCGECPQPVNDTSGNVNAQIINLLPIEDCGNLTDGLARSKALETGEDYCSCVKDERTKGLCRQALLDNLYYHRAINSYDSSICEYISDATIKEACVAVSDSGAEYVKTTEDFWGLIFSYRQNQNFEELITLVEEKLVESPNDVALLSVLADSYATLAWNDETGENHKKAQEYISKILVLDPNHAEAYRIQGYLYETQFDIVAAIDSYTKALDIDPEHIDALVGRAHAYRLLGDSFAALEDFEKAKELDPDGQYLTIYSNLCTMLSGNAAMISDAIENCMIVIDFPVEVATEKAEAYNTVGSLYLRSGETEEAIDSFNKALSYLPNNANTYAYLAAAYSGKGAYAEAEINARKALTIESKKSIAYSELSYALYKQGKLDAAEDAALTALDYVDDDPALLSSSVPAAKREIYSILANIYNAKGETANEQKYAKLAEDVMNL